MHLPRFTIRRMMVVVSLMAVGLGISEEMRRERGLAARYHAEAVVQDACAAVCEDRPPNLKQAAYHAAMARKYRYAARYPWLPVAPEPPWPKVNETEPASR